jgi:hypothetical protein
MQGKERKLWNQGQIHTSNTGSSEGNIKVIGKEKQVTLCLERNMTSLLRTAFCIKHPEKWLE